MTISGLAVFVWLQLSSQMVIELDDVQIEGDIRRPNIIEMEGSKLTQSIEKAALFNLLSLEKKLLKLRPLESFRKSRNSAIKAP
ncbi:MAG: hypothetical protein COV44_01175 [Deltaproteobacteria bacterium CG11_big_fil_rev_8_21_14_0_20_45_16]|nr:MAG: hypothetical protein COV44_01175 [Deltaproteobacteria bacterium CG11_big_fil_rev_8_21_14_0_20_45_16]